jgi:hypothetical protein
MKKFSEWFGSRQAMDPMADAGDRETQLQARWPVGTPVAINNKMGMMTGVIKSVNPWTQMAVVLDDNQRPIEVPVGMLRKQQ